MKKKGLSEEDIALWRYAVRDVTPLDKRRKMPIEEKPTRVRRLIKQEPQATPTRQTEAKPATPITDRLDDHWERPIKRGRVQVERTLDLHGYSRDRAYGVLMRFMEQAVRDANRVLLIITGKGRGGKGAGVLRTSVPDWLKDSHYAPHILSIRSSHPTHGGEGAIYVILRRLK